MSIHHTAPLLRLLTTHACRAQPPHLIPFPTRQPSLRRRLATTVAAEQGSGRAHAVLVRLPTPEALDADDDGEVAPLDGSEARLQITERAAEKLRAIAMSEGNMALALRVGVESGGCHGYQYKMELTEHPAPDDYQFAHPTHRPSSVVVDAVSLGLLKGSTIDYATELIGSSFRVVDNPQAKGSGCGCGVSWEANF